MTNTGQPQPVSNPSALRETAWIAPLATVVALEIAEFTRPALDPSGNDGNGTSTAS